MDHGGCWFYLDAEKLNQMLGKFNGGGLGYGLPASFDAALALKDAAKVCVDLQPDGDLLFTVSGLWRRITVYRY